MNETVQVCSKETTGVCNGVGFSMLSIWPTSCPGSCILYFSTFHGPVYCTSVLSMVLYTVLQYFPGSCILYFSTFHGPVYFPGSRIRYFSTVYWLLRYSISKVNGGHQQKLTAMLLPGTPKCERTMHTLQQIFLMHMFQQIVLMQCSSRVSAVRSQ